MAGEPALVKLREYAVQVGRADIEDRHRSYVTSVRTLFQVTDDFDAIVTTLSAREPQNVRPWAPLLSALFDVEHVRAKFVAALSKARDAAVSPTSQAGDEFDYHREHWIFQGGAFIARVDNAISKSVRLLLRPTDRAWAAFGKGLADDFHARAGEGWASVRNPLAHELGGGVDALTPYWLPLLALHAGTMDIEAVVREITSSASEAKTQRDLVSLCNEMERATLHVLAESEGIFERLLTRLADVATAK